MDCKDIDLISYIEGKNLSDEEREHVSKCSLCQKEVKKLEKAIGLLSSYFKISAKDCPDHSTLIDYAFDELEPSKEDAVKNHLASCDTCQKNADLLKLFYNEFSYSFPPEGLRPLPQPIKKKLKELKKVSLSKRLTKSIRDIKEKGEIGIDKAKELVEKIVAAEPEVSPVPASPKDITKVEKEEGDKEKEEKETEDKEDKEKDSKK